MDDKVTYQALVLLIATLYSTNCISAIYKWVDEEGNVSFSSIRPPSVEKTVLIKADKSDVRRWTTASLYGTWYSRHDGKAWMLKLHKNNIFSMSTAGDNTEFIVSYDGDYEEHSRNLIFTFTTKNSKSHRLEKTSEKYVISSLTPSTLTLRNGDDASIEYIRQHTINRNYRDDRLLGYWIDTNGTDIYYFTKKTLEISPSYATPSDEKGVLETRKLGPVEHIANWKFLKNELKINYYGDARNKTRIGTEEYWAIIRLEKNDFWYQFNKNEMIKLRRSSL